MTISDDDKARYLRQSPDLLGRYESLDLRFQLLAKLTRMLLIEAGWTDETISGASVNFQAAHTLASTSVADLDAAVMAMCHNLHGRVDARAFTDGCVEEQRRLYGCAPDRDMLNALRDGFGVPRP